MRHLNRLIEPTSGEVLFDGRNILDLSPAALRSFRAHRVSVFQSFRVDAAPHRYAECDLRPESAGRIETGSARNRSEWIEAVNLTGYENKYPHELSGGMRQRVGLARALAADTDVILMDEAFSALDPLIRAEMQDLLLQLQTDLRKSVVFITHDLEEALRIGSKIAILKDGRLVQVGKPADILNNPANDYVARFVRRRRVGVEAG